MAAAAAAALRPGEMSEKMIADAVRAASPWTLEYKRNFMIKDLPADRYIISVKGQMIYCGNYSTGWVSGCNSRNAIYVVDNHGCVYTAHTPQTKSMHDVFHAQGEQYPGFESPLSPAEIEFIKAMPLYDPPFSRKFKALAKKLCDEPENKKPAEAAEGGAAAGAGGGASAPPQDEDPSHLAGGRRNRKRTIRRGRRRRA